MCLRVSLFHLARVLYSPVDHEQPWTKGHGEKKFSWETIAARLRSDGYNNASSVNCQRKFDAYLAEYSVWLKEERKESGTEHSWHSNEMEQMMNSINENYSNFIEAKATDKAAANAARTNKEREGKGLMDAAEGNASALSTPQRPRSRSEGSSGDTRSSKRNRPGTPSSGVSAAAALAETAKVRAALEEKRMAQREREREKERELEREKLAAEKEEREKERQEAKAERADRAADRKTQSDMMLAMMKMMGDTVKELAKKK